MVLTWQVPELQTDFTVDFEDLLIAYIYAKWSIINPAKGTVMQPDDVLEPEKVSFRPGFPDYFKPYECCVVQTRTDVKEVLSDRYVFTTTCQCMLRMKRIERDAIEPDPQLENMELEIERIVEHYKPNEITGIKEMLFDTLSVERVYNARDTFAKSDWRSIVRIKLFYEKEKGVA